MKYDFPTAEDRNYFMALGLMVVTGRGSTSYIQRTVHVTYAEAVVIMSRLEAEGVVAKPNHVGKREVLIRLAVQQ